MNQTKRSTIGGLVAIFTAFLWLLPSVGEAQGGGIGGVGGGHGSVDCRKKETIQAAVDSSKPGDTIVVSGTCNESVLIGETVNNLTLDGQGTVIINSPTGSDTIIVRGRGIIIKGFVITGGSNGILVNKGGAVGIIDNAIENNSSHGVHVGESSSARIGFLSFNDTVASPNLIQNNDGDGIRVQRSSSARIVGNTIRGNNRNGIEVRRVSHAEISDNVIDDNRRRGINVNANSGVNLGVLSGGTIFQLPNNTNVIGRQDVGIRCRNNSYIRGRLGTLTGAGGQVDASDSCDVDVDP